MHGLLTVNCHECCKFVSGHTCYPDMHINICFCFIKTGHIFLDRPTAAPDIGQREEGNCQFKDKVRFYIIINGTNLGKLTNWSSKWCSFLREH